MSPIELREQVVRALEQELIGPDPIPPRIQPNGEEILTTDPPRLRYGAGILFPQASEAETSTDAAPGESTDPPPDGPAGDESDMTDTPATDGLTGRPAGGAEPPPTGDEAATAANAYLPSAIGVSCLLELPQADLRVEVSAAKYRKVSTPEMGSDGVQRVRDHFHREPFEAEVMVSAASLSGDDVVSLPPAVVLAAGIPTGLTVHLLSRPQAAVGASVRRLLTVTLVNTHKNAGSAPPNDLCFFQVRLTLSAADGGACFLEYPDGIGQSIDAEEEQAALLYRHRRTYAVGHGVAADWVEHREGRATQLSTEALPRHEIKPIVPAQFADLPLRMKSLSEKDAEAQTLATLTGLCDRYDAWIDERDREAHAAELPAQHRAAAEANLAQCRSCLKRMRDGVQLLKAKSRAMTAFRLMNKAMLEQQLHYSLPLREWTAPKADAVPPVVWPDLDTPPPGKGAWYPFQLAFILLNLRSLTAPDAEADWPEHLAERGLVDLVWFPTGGGKTEAYLGLTAYAILMRRLRNPRDGGTTVLMRYTLRLLTAQQFQRAASLICALERLRRAHEKSLGDVPISIGLWVGSLTPTTRRDATDALDKLSRDDRADNLFVVLKCPWCGVQMGPHRFGNQPHVFGYERDSNIATVVFRCPDRDCPFGGKSRLPLSVVDEDLYAEPPTLLFGTVDKFAMLPWRPKAHSFFGLHKAELSPPELIIQDELHLISGPLGSMVGHYETVIQELCAREDSGRRVGPKIVASTATISRASEQCHALYNCGPANVQLFPPQALRAGESFFAREDEAAAGRLYVGVMAPALSSYVTAQARVMACLLQAPLSADASEERERDPCWTLMGYFNNLRVLGHAVTLVRADIPEHMGVIRFRKGIAKPAEGERDGRRFINHLLELTSREGSARIAEALQKLERPYPGTGNQMPVDVCLATNMISVGLDVPRLGLMTVVGQPKTTSEYIQATSRVGRRTPGLVVTLYHPGKPRDRSHYEHFRSYHQSIYRQVEPTSVTPFAPPVRERALHALLVALVRQRGSAGTADAPEPMPSKAVLDYVRDVVRARAEGVDRAESADTISYLDYKIQQWRNVLPRLYGKPGGPAPDELPLMYPAGSEPSPDWENRSWKTPTSMRDVDAECEAGVLGQYP